MASDSIRSLNTAQSRSCYIFMFFPNVCSQTRSNYECLNDHPTRCRNCVCRHVHLYDVSTGHIYLAVDESSEHQQCIASQENGNTIINISRIRSRIRIRIRIKIIHVSNNYQIFVCPKTQIYYDTTHSDHISIPLSSRTTTTT